MAEEKNENVVTAQKDGEQDTNFYIEAIKEMKANSVSKDAYIKLQDENKKLLESLIKGDTIEAPKAAAPEEKVDLAALRKHLNEAESPIDYCKTSLKLHEETLKQTGVNDYLPNGKKLDLRRKMKRRRNYSLVLLKSVLTMRTEMINSLSKSYNVELIRV